MGVMTGLALAGLGSSIVGGMMQSRAARDAAREQRKSDKASLEYLKDKDALEQVSWADSERRKAPRRGMAAAAEGFLARNFFPGGWANPISQMAESPSEQYARQQGQSRLGMPASRPSEGPSGMPMGASLYEPVEVDEERGVMGTPEWSPEAGHELGGDGMDYGAPRDSYAYNQPAPNMLGNPPGPEHYGHDDIYGAPVSLREGTGGEFVDFGEGTPAILHGKEAIVPIGDEEARRKVGSNQGTGTQARRRPGVGYRGAGAALVGRRRPGPGTVGPRTVNMGRPREGQRPAASPRGSLGYGGVGRGIMPQRPMYNPQAHNMGLHRTGFPPGAGARRPRQPAPNHGAPMWAQRRRPMPPPPGPRAPWGGVSVDASRSGLVRREPRSEAVRPGVTRPGRGRRPQPARPMMNAANLGGYPGTPNRPEYDTY